MTPLLSRRLAAFLIAFFALAANAADLRVATSGGSTAALKKLAPEYERKTGNTVTLIFGASMGETPDAIPNRLSRGEPIDVVVMVDSALDGLIKQGQVDGASKTVLAKSVIAVAVKAGAPHPDISTSDAVRQMLLHAKSVAYSDSASGVYLRTTLFPRLGIADQMKDKARAIPGTPVGEVVGRGEAEVGFQQLSELRPVAGIDILGPIPDSIQLVTPYSAGRVTASTHASEAKAFMDFLASPAAAEAIRSTGLVPSEVGAEAHAH